MFTKSKEILSNDVHVKQMMLNAIQVTLSNYFYEYNFITKLPLKQWRSVTFQIRHAIVMTSSALMTSLIIRQ